jgi:hypothetical protein
MLLRAGQTACRLALRGTVALSSDVCRHYPRIIESGKQLGWEWIRLP